MNAMYYATPRQPRIGEERFNYDLQRREILLEAGWTPCYPEPEDDEMPIKIYAVLKGCTHEQARPIFSALSSGLKDRFRAAANLAALDDAGLHLQIQRLQSEVEAWKTVFAGVKGATKQAEAELDELRKRQWLPVEPGDHDYHGPLAKDPDTGKMVPARDPVHEAFYAAVGHVLAGRVIPAAVNQMMEACRNAPRPRAELKLRDDPEPKRIGWRMNDAV